MDIYMVVLRLIHFFASIFSIWATIRFRCICTRNGSLSGSMKARWHSR